MPTRTSVVLLWRILRGRGLWILLIDDSLHLFLLDRLGRKINCVLLVHNMHTSGAKMAPKWRQDGAKIPASFPMILSINGVRNWYLISTRFLRMAAAVIVCWRIPSKSSMCGRVAPKWRQPYPPRVANVCHFNLFARACKGPPLFIRI